MALGPLPAWMSIPAPGFQKGRIREGHVEPGLGEAKLLLSVLRSVSIQMQLSVPSQADLRPQSILCAPTTSQVSLETSTGPSQQGFQQNRAYSPMATNICHKLTDLLSSYSGTSCGALRKIEKTVLQVTPLEPHSPVEFG